MSNLRQEERDDAQPQDEAFANQDDLHPSDRAVMGLESEDENRDEGDRIPDSLSDDDDIYKDVGTQPQSERTSVVLENDDHETLDGLDELEESIREEAEDRPIGSARGFGS